MATDLAKVSNIRVKLDVKRIRDAGNGEVTNASLGCVVTFNKDFVDVNSIVISPARDDTNAPTHAYDFTDVPNPTSFTVFLYATKGASAGNKITGFFSWSAEGI
jgi:hypothetical protein